MTTQQIANDIEKLLEELDTEAIQDMTEEELLSLRSKLNPYGRIIEGSDNYLNFSYTNLEENYQKKLLMTGMIGYLNTACNEYHVPDGHPVIDVYDYYKNPTLIDEYAKNWGSKDKETDELVKTEKIIKEIEDNKAWMQKRIIIKQFLEHCFQYNPDVHVRSSYKPQPKDIARNVIDTPAANLAIAELSKRDVKFREQMLEYDRVQKMIAMKRSIGEEPSPELTELVAKKLVLPGQHYKNADYESWKEEDKNLLHTVCNMIPPADIFQKFRNYYEINYDKLREAVLYLYCDKPQLDIAICPHSWHSSDEEASDFKKKHSGEVITDVITAHSGKWNFVAPFKHVRESMKFFNKDTAVLEAITEQIEKDAKIGAELVKNTIKQKKKQNIEQEGPDDDLFKKWKSENTTLKDMKAITLDDDDIIMNEAPLDSIAVKVFRIGDTGLESDHFYTRAEAPELPSEGPSK